MKELYKLIEAKIEDNKKLITINNELGNYGVCSELSFKNVALYEALLLMVELENQNNFK